MYSFNNPKCNKGIFFFKSTISELDFQFFAHRNGNGDDVDQMVY